MNNLDRILVLLGRAETNVESCQIYPNRAGLAYQTEQVARLRELAVDAALGDTTDCEGCYGLGYVNEPLPCECCSESRECGTCEGTGRMPIADAIDEMAYRV